MSILPQLEKNKGTISSSLGKSLAQEVLAGDTSLLEEAVELLDHGEKNVRASAAKIVEQVAMAEPSLVVGYLPRLLPALDQPEPQTRWMIIHAIGCCASLDAATAMEALPRAQEYVEGDSGACLWGATVIYLGHLGATSEANARTVYPILELTLREIPRQIKNVLESFLRMIEVGDPEIRAAIARHAEACAQHEKAGVRRVARKLQRELG